MAKSQKKWMKMTDRLQGKKGMLKTKKNGMYRKEQQNLQKSDKGKNQKMA